MNLCRAFCPCMGGGTRGFFCCFGGFHAHGCLILQESIIKLRQHRTIPALRLKHRSGSCGTASALPIGSLFPPLAALTFAASSIICAFGLASAAPRSPYRHLELCGIVFIIYSLFFLIPHPRPLSFHKKFPDIFCLPLLTSAPVGSIIMLTYEQSFI